MTIVFILIVVISYSAVMSGMIINDHLVVIPEHAQNDAPLYVKFGIFLTRKLFCITDLRH